LHPQPSCSFDSGPGRDTLSGDGCRQNCTYSPLRGQRPKWLVSWTTPVLKLFSLCIARSAVKAIIEATGWPCSRLLDFQRIENVVHSTRETSLAAPYRDIDTMSDTQPPPPPPPGVPPPLPANLPHDSLVLNIILSSAICWWIAAIFVALRFYTRGIIIRVIGASDWSILLALVCQGRRRKRVPALTEFQIFSGATCGSVIERSFYNTPSSQA
jgi:hypothetical protein